LCTACECLVKGFGPEGKLGEEDPVTGLDHLRHLLGRAKLLLILIVDEFFHFGCFSLLMFET
jgi:hypothetical protein